MARDNVILSMEEQKPAKLLLWWVTCSSFTQTVLIGRRAMLVRLIFSGFTVASFTCLLSNRYHYECSLSFAVVIGCMVWIALVGEEAIKVLKIVWRDHR